VDGEPFDVWPESSELVEPVAASSGMDTPAKVETGPSETPDKVAVPGRGDKEHAESKGNNLRLVQAPIPGVVLSIAVHPGSKVIVGQELLVLEAMKMKNSIRATRSGRIATVNVTIGLHVKHRDVLIEYEGNDGSDRSIAGYLEWLQRLTWGNAIMITVAGILIALAVVKEYEPMLLLPIGFMLLAGQHPLTGMTDGDGIFGLMYRAESALNYFRC
jgi:biotin carboxyl carrier protein